MEKTAIHFRGANINVRHHEIGWQSPTPSPSPLLSCRRSGEVYEQTASPPELNKYQIAVSQRRTDRAHARMR